MTWLAEREVDAVLAAELIASQFPQLAGTSVVPLGAGWDNTVHLVDDRWAFRFPRRQVALDGVGRETALLPRLAPSLPVAVPVPVFLGVATDAFSWDFTGAAVLPGRELALGGVPEQARSALGSQVGSFLRVLHDPSLTAELGAGLLVDPMARSDPARRWLVTRPWVEALVGSWRPDRAVEDLLAQATPLGPSTGPFVLSHGDLHLRHLLVDEHGGASGVLDWGDVCLADPCVDLSLAYAGFEGTEREALLSAYGHVDKPTELRARVLALCLCLALAANAQQDGDDVRLAECLRGADRALR